MAKVTLATIENRILLIQRQLNRLLSHVDNGVDISRALGEFNDRLFTPLRKDVLKFLYQEDVSFSAKKALFDIVQKTGKEILNEHTQAQVDAEDAHENDAPAVIDIQADAENAHEQDDPAEIDAQVDAEDAHENDAQAEIDIQADAENAHEQDDPEEEVDQGNELLEMVVNRLDELDDLVSNILFRDQNISLEDINPIHRQYFDSQSLKKYANFSKPMGVYAWRTGYVKYCRRASVGTKTKATTSTKPRSCCNPRHR